MSENLIHDLEVRNQELEYLCNMLHVMLIDTFKDTLANGNTHSIKNVQYKLNILGASVIMDGLNGPKTEEGLSDVDLDLVCKITRAANNLKYSNNGVINFTEEGKQLHSNLRKLAHWCQTVDEKLETTIPKSNSASYCTNEDIITDYDIDAYFANASLLGSKLDRYRYQKFPLTIYYPPFNSNC